MKYKIGFCGGHGERWQKGIKSLGRMRSIGKLIMSMPTVSWRMLTRGDGGGGGGAAAVARRILKSKGDLPG